jgi:HD-like signal output (HDOD) protein
MTLRRSLPSRPEVALRGALDALLSEVPQTPTDEAVGERLLDAGMVDTRALGPLGKVPAFGPAAITVLRMFDRDNIAVAQVSRAVACDTAMLSQLLAIANSPLFGNDGYITSPDRAILLLGVQRTKALAATIAMRSLAAGSPKRSIVRRIWRHSVATATIAEAIAPCYQIAPEPASVAGVLHDLGRFGLLGAWRDAYAALVTRRYADQLSVLQAETDACGMDHTRAGSLLGAAWRIPESLRAVTGRHHDPPPDNPLCRLIHLACQLADCLSFPAIAYERRPAPEAIAEPEVLAHLANMEQRIHDRLIELDF